ncbi:MAG: hypothetical protein KAJ40_02470 [Alphaproteobacteria bacterium]|nr:hypothetical protein [Alphaproteobacteria bacterium]
MTNKALCENTPVRDVLKSLSTSDFKSFGLRQIAYIRPIKTAETSYYQICRANGEEITNVETLALAKVLARQEDLDPMIVN